MNSTNTHEITVGSTVRVVEGPEYSRCRGLKGKVVEIVSGLYAGRGGALIDFGKGFDGHNGNSFGNLEHSGESCWWVAVDDLAPATKPVFPSAPQTRAVLNTLKEKGTLSGVEAAATLRVRSLTKRISELKTLGWNIVTEWKKDPTGQRYARYHLVEGVAG